MSKYFKDPMRIDQLNEIEHWVTQENGTERPGTGKYLNNKKIGIYVDIVSESLYFHPMISMNLGVVGQALPNH